MANKKPSALTAASALDGTEIAHFVQSGNSRKVTGAQIKTLALAPFGANGLAARTAAETFSARTITGTAAEITVTNGDGVAGNPTLSLPAALTFTGKTVTGGTFNGAQVDQIEVGHASDTTLARSSAGNLSVEGNLLYRAGGTDVPLADGGTGASLVDPNADRILFWDDSAGQVTWLSLDPGLEISGTTLRTARGTSFPVSPANGDRFLRTDVNIECFYDGTRWLSTELLISTGSIQAVATTGATILPIPYYDLYDIYIERVNIGTQITSATTGTNYFNAIQLTSADGAGASTTYGTARSNQSDTQNIWVNRGEVIGSVIDLTSDERHIFIGYTRQGSGTMNTSMSIAYRLVVV